MNISARLSDYLAHICSAIERIERYTAEMDEPDFLVNELVQDAVFRNLEVIGEAAKNIQKADPFFAEAHSEIPWQVMYSMRNRLTHGYDTVDVEIVWRTVRHDLPVLYRLVQSVQMG